MKTKQCSFTSWERETHQWLILWKVPQEICTGSKGTNDFKDGCVGIALSTPKQRVRTYVGQECLAAYPQILTGKDVIQPLIEVAIRREPYVVEHRATTKHGRHGLWKEEKTTTFFHAKLSWKTWNFLFWGNHVLSCLTGQKKKKKTLQRNREEAHRAHIMFWMFVCFNDARVLKLQTFHNCYNIIYDRLTTPAFPLWGRGLRQKLHIHTHKM